MVISIPFVWKGGHKKARERDPKNKWYEIHTKGKKIETGQFWRKGDHLVVKNIQTFRIRGTRIYVTASEDIINRDKKPRRGRLFSTKARGRFSRVENRERSWCIFRKREKETDSASPVNNSSGQWHIWPFGLDKEHSCSYFMIPPRLKWLNVSKFSPRPGRKTRSTKLDNFLGHLAARRRWNRERGNEHWHLLALITPIKLLFRMGGKVLSTHTGGSFA